MALSAEKTKGAATEAAAPFHQSCRDQELIVSVPMLVLSETSPPRAPKADEPEAASPPVAPPPIAKPPPIPMGAAPPALAAPPTAPEVLVELPKASPPPLPLCSTPTDELLVGKPLTVLMKILLLSDVSGVPAFCRAIPAAEEYSAMAMPIRGYR